MRSALLLLAIAATGAAAGVQAAPRRPYAVAGTCDGFPRVTLGLAPGLCAGLVHQTIGGRPGPLMPRSLLALDAEGRDWLVTDLGGWRSGRGGVWRLRLPAGREPDLRRVLDGVSMPHTVARGPDGAVYVGEMSRIFRFDPEAQDPAAGVTPVITGLPDNRLHDDRHPLSAFLFARDGALWVNVGAPSDACEESRTPDGRCADTEGDAGRAVVRRHAPAGPGRWEARFTVPARGLRNSVALLQTTGGAVLQAENSYDFPDRNSPHDEVNVLGGGRHHGWPYCFDADRRSPAFQGSAAMDCRGPAHARPLLLLPPHVAPIAMAYAGSRAPTPARGRLLMTWRGYRPAGAKVVAFAVDARALPKPGPRLLVSDWSARPGVRPRGAPAGLAVAPDGAIWVCDDKNGAILRLAPDRP